MHVFTGVYTWLLTKYAYTYLDILCIQRQQPGNGRGPILKELTSCLADSSGDFIDDTRRELEVMRLALPTDD